MTACSHGWIHPSYCLDCRRGDDERRAERMAKADKYDALQARHKKAISALFDAARILRAIWEDGIDSVGAEIQTAYEDADVVLAAEEEIR